MALGAVASVHAADLGGLKILSAAGDPLRAEIAVTALTPQEASTLKAAVAPRDVYRQTRLEYAEALSQLKLSVEDRPGGRKVVVVTSAAPLDVHVLDLLVELTWNMGRFIRQYTFILDTPAPRALAPESGVPASGSIAVNPGDTLYGIAGRLQPEGTSVLQVMAALFHANPQAFIQGNMNLLRAGASLAAPTAEAIAAIDPAEAQALFASHAQAFEAYRQRIAGQAGQQPAAAESRGAEARGEIAKSAAAPVVPPVSEGDAVRLSGGGQASDERGMRDRLEEERDATAKAVREAEERMRLLQSNVEAMRGLLEAQNETLARMEQQARERAGAEAVAVPPPTPAVPEGASDAAPASPSSEPPGPASTDSATSAADEAPSASPAPAGSGEGGAEAQPAGGQAEQGGLQDAPLVRKIQDHSVAVFGAIVALLAVIFSALALRRRGARAEDDQAREAELREDGDAQDDPDSLPPSEPQPVNHLRDWDDIPPFPIPAATDRVAGEAEDYPDDDEPVADAAPPAGPIPPAAAAAFALDLNLGGQPPSSSTNRAPGGEPGSPELDLSPDLGAGTDPAAKLDLAKAYADMGDREGARELLEEVLRDGDAVQRERARALLATW